jgi:hypothetical protein
MLRFVAVPTELLVDGRGEQKQQENEIQTEQKQMAKSITGTTYTLLLYM